MKKSRTRSRARRHSLEARLGASLIVLVVAIIGVAYLLPSDTKPQPELSSLPIGPLFVSPQEIDHGDTTKKQVIFTFDGGSGDDSVEQILDALDKHQIRGTFFLTGKFVEAYPDVVRRMVSEGHEVNDHTYHHPHLTELPNAKIVEELELMNKALQTAAATSSRPFFRPPYGDRDARVNHAAAAAGYRSVYWTVDAKDWKESTGETDESVTERILSSAKPGTIYLMHLGDAIAGRILDGVFTELESRGYRIVSLSEGI